MHISECGMFKMAAAFVGYIVNLQDKADVVCSKSASDGTKDASKY